VSALVEVRDLTVRFPSEAGTVEAVRGVSLDVRAGEVLGIVGESGSGKTVMSLSVIGLLPDTATVSGSIRFGGRDLLALDDAEMSRLRGSEIAMVFQDPLSALNPVHTIGRQIAEALLIHQDIPREAAAKRAVELLEVVGIPRPDERAQSYPHEFSGGMRQRVMIALAIANQPKVILADEPTTALDVTIQAQILDLLQEMKSTFGMAIMLITHAMGVVAETAQRVVVMYAGRVVEEAGVKQLFRNPRHPYTQGLIRSIPRIDTAATQKVRLESIPGVVPSLLHPPQGCRFAARCKFATDACRKEQPPLREIEPGHKVACIL
jgi:peptide/nickel transport system ATP-binding protein